MNLFAGKQDRKGNGFMLVDECVNYGDSKYVQNIYSMKSEVLSSENGIQKINRNFTDSHA